MSTASPLIMSSRPRATLERRPVTDRIVENGFASEIFSTWMLGRFASEPTAAGQFPMGGQDLRTQSKTFEPGRISLPSSSAWKNADKTAVVEGMRPGTRPLHLGARPQELGVPELIEEVAHRAQPQ